MHEQLDRYLLQRLITPAEHAAGLQFGEDHHAARRWAKQRGSDDHPSALRYRRACAELGELQGLVVAVAVTGLDPTVWAERVGRPHFQGLPELQRALRLLVSFYDADEARAA